LRYTKKSLKIYKEIEDLNGMAQCYTNIGEVYRYKGLLDEAIKYYKLGLELDESVGAYYEAGVDYNVLGEIYLEKKDFDQALLYFEKALVIRRKGGGISLSETLADLGELCYKKR
ncbi:MAG: tetratricopeptide repeat protein, partial [Candidatus Omnitrophota bacterium]